MPKVITRPVMNEKIERELTCGICLFAYVNPVQINCSHLFCKSCMEALVKYTSTCPKCRGPIGDSSTWRRVETVNNLIDIYKEYLPMSDCRKTKCRAALEKCGERS